jgi:hypothetical protein
MRTGSGAFGVRAFGERRFVVSEGRVAAAMRVVRCPPPMPRTKRMSCSTRRFGMKSTRTFRKTMSNTRVRGCNRRCSFMRTKIPISHRQGLTPAAPRCRDCAGRRSEVGSGSGCYTCPCAFVRFSLGQSLDCLPTASVRCRISLFCSVGLPRGFEPVAVRVVCRLNRKRCDVGPHPKRQPQIVGHDL